MKKILLVILCFFLPPLAVLFHDGLSRKVLWALLWQLLGHIPGVIYGILVVTKEPAK
ncbi:YqaE/Pmp3 family membrane protein [Sinomonas susongensis]|uniref:YqaE/Pmp3 family membrane protein n=1 Tax=Sinomonas susongensis TaxID=1324851 RepID=UPI001108E197|nr:YqaE/Pmp3 family membrane protein [Sinomonas susongensis]